MLEGLEIQELNLSVVQFENRSFRFDSTFFVKNAVDLDLKMKAANHFFLEEKNVVSGPFGSTLKSHAYLTEGVPFVRIENIKGGFEISTAEIIYISEEDNERLRNSQLFIDDLVLSKVGNTIGYYARVDEELGRCNISENNIGIKLGAFPVHRRHFILTYLNSEIGRILTLRRISGNAQPKLNVFDISEIPIPTFKEEFEKSISQLVIESRSLKHNSVSKYQQAENELLKTLELSDFEPSKEPVNIKSFSESFGSSGRLDAEYYQIKNEDYETLVKLYRSGHEPFEIACSLKDKNFNPEDKTEYNYIELANIGKSGEIKDCTTGFGEELPSRARRKVATNDVVVSSIEGSLDSCALVTTEYNNALCSTGFYVVKSKKLNPETLLVLFKSEPMQALLKKGCSGTILTAISKTELSKIPIPLIDKETQESIKTKINESFDLRKQSEHLLEVAKTAVEMAIEQDEATAIAYIKETTFTAKG